MTKVYSVPEEFADKIPYLLPFEGWFSRCEEFEKQLAEWCLKNGGDKKYGGKIAAFPIADGHAQYMVYKIRPLELIHMPTGDSWHYPYIERLTAKDIKARIDRGARLTKLKPMF